MRISSHPLPSFFVFILSTFHRRVDRLFSQPTNSPPLSLSPSAFSARVSGRRDRRRERHSRHRVAYASTNHGGRFLGRFSAVRPIVPRPRIIYRPRMTKHNLRRVCTYIYMYSLHDAADAAALLFDVYEYMLVVSLHRACELSCKFFSFLQDISMFDT